MIFALSGLGDQAIPTFIEILRHPDRLVQMRACESLAAAIQSRGLDRQPFLELIPEILRLLQHDWHMLRWRAASLLGALHSDPDRCIPALMRCLYDPYPEVQGASARALGYYGDGASKALPRLLELSNAQDRPLRCLAISALGYFSDLSVLPVLVQALRNPTVSTSAIYSLKRRKWPSDILVPALCDCVRDGDSVLRWAATEALGRYQQEAVAAIPVLREALAGPSPALRKLIANTLECIEGGEAK